MPVLKHKQHCKAQENRLYKYLTRQERLRQEYIRKSVMADWQSLFVA